MKQITFVAILAVVSAHSLLADVTLTDKSSAARIISINSTQPRSQSAPPLTPEQRAAIRAANEAKRAAKRAKQHPLSGKRKSTFGLGRGTNATGSVALIDAGGLKYFINTNITFSTSSSASGAASEASYTGPILASTSAGGVVTSTLNDMFDGYNTICLSFTNATGPCATGDPNYSFYNMNGPASVDTTVPAVPECTNRQYVFPVKTIAGVSIQRKVYVPTNDQFIRWTNSFTNTTGAPITFTMITGNNLGSDSNTIIVSSSSGDAAAQTNDLWVTTFQNFSGAYSTDPRIGHVLQGTGALTPVSSINFANGNDNPFWGYSITLAPGQTKLIINYAVGMGSKAAANTQAAAVAAFGPTARQCLSATELGQVANFAVTADLSIVKTSSAPAAVGGTAYSYTLNVSNAGPISATAVSVVDTLPAGVSFVSASGTGWTCGQVAGTVTCTLPTLAVGAATPITINVTAPLTSGVVSNTASVTSTTTDPNLANNSSTAGVTVTANADLAITKTASTPTVIGGGGYSYTLSVSNAGLSVANALVVTDTLPAGVTPVSVTGTGWTCGQAGATITCTLPALGVGTANPIALNVTAPLTSGVVTNTATITSGTTDPNPVNNTSTIGVTVTANADLAITKTASLSGVIGGGAYSYTLNVSNTGASVANAVSVTDALPAGVTFVSVSGTGWTCGQAAGTVTCTLASLAVGAANPITINVTAPLTSGPVSNTATVSSATVDPNLANNTSTAAVTVTANADLAIANTASAATVNGGGAYSYTLNVSNIGPSTANNVTVTDAMAPGANYVSASGTGWVCNYAALTETVTCTMASLAGGAANPITINVTAPLVSGFSTNTATVASSTADPAMANNTSSSGVMVTADADLAITKTAKTSPAFGTYPATYTLAVTNNGPLAASGVSVSDTLPAGATFVGATGTGWTCNSVAGVVTCTTPTLAVGAAPPITLTMNAPPVTASGTLVNTATVSSSGTTDPTPGNDSSTSSTPIEPGAAIPALAPWMLALLGIILALGGGFVVKRH